MSRLVYGVFLEERAYAEEGGDLIHRELVMVCPSRAEAQEYADAAMDGVTNLTSRISLVVRAVEVAERQYRMVAGREMAAREE